MAWKTVQSRSYVDVEEKVYNDREGVDRVTSLPDFAAYWNVDWIILEAASDGDNASFKHGNRLSVNYLLRGPRSWEQTKSIVVRSDPHDTDERRRHASRQRRKQADA